MATSNIKKVLALFEAIASRDADLAAKDINPKKYTEHNPAMGGDGVEGWREYIGHLPRESHRKVVRVFEDGPYVFTQAGGQIFGQGVFFDVFRFEDGLIVEHWGFSAPSAPPNESGHTQTDGPTSADPSGDTEKNKAVLRAYYETAHIARDHGNIRQYFSGDIQIRHEPGVRDGVAAFLHDVAILMRHRTIDEIRLLLGERDFVFVAAMGTVEGEPCAYIDLYRLEGGKLIEHWGFPEKLLPRTEWRNSNGPL